MTTEPVYMLQTLRERYDYRGYKIVRTVDNTWMVLAAGLQLGGRIDASGVGDATFATLEAARQFIRERVQS